MDHLTLISHRNILWHPTSYDNILHCAEQHWCSVTGLVILKGISYVFFIFYIFMSSQIIYQEYKALPKMLKICLNLKNFSTYHKLVEPCASCIRYKNAWIVWEGEFLWPPMESSPFSLSTVHIETDFFMLHHQLTDQIQPFSAMIPHGISLKLHFFHTLLSFLLNFCTLINNLEMKFPEK